MIFLVYVVVLVAWEALAILSGDRPPPTVTDTVRRLPGWAQAVAALAVLVIPALHLFEVIA